MVDAPRLWPREGRLWVHMIVAYLTVVIAVIARFDGRPVATEDGDSVTVLCFRFI